MPAKRYMKCPAIRGAAVSVLAFLCVLALFLYSISAAQSKAGGQEIRILRDALRRAAITCYAVEGRYPPSVKYVQQHYGVVIDGEKYIARYDSFASNVMPGIIVLVQGADEI